MDNQTLITTTSFLLTAISLVALAILMSIQPLAHSIERCVSHLADSLWKPLTTKIDAWLQRRDAARRQRQDESLTRMIAVKLAEESFRQMGPPQQT